VGRSCFVGKLEQPTIIQNSLHRVRGEASDLKWLHYCLRHLTETGWIANLSKSATISHFTQEKLQIIQIPWPDSETRSRIAAFLDERTANIDALVAELTEFSETLKLQRKALINECVTKGVPGISEALHITPTKLKYLAEIPIQTGLGEKGDRNNPDWPRYIRTTDIASPRTLRKDIFASIPPDVASKAMLRRGDVLMSTAGSVGKTFLFREESPACYAGYLARFRPGPNILPEFASFWTESEEFLTQIELGKVKSTIDNFSAGKYQNMKISLPRLDEQAMIAVFLEERCDKIDNTLSEIETQIGLLRQYRKSLISEAVTGKIEV
jgi:type I restriction enzyme S subunit